ncbi:MAG: hypothetical protein ABIF06_00075 [bacterium]
MKKQHLLPSFLIFAFFTVILPVMAETGTSNTPERAQVREAERAQEGEPIMVQEQEMRTLRFETHAGLSQEFKDKMEAGREEMQAKRDALEKEANQRREERMKEAEARKLEIESKREEMQAKRVEFQQETAKRRVENTKKVTLATVERLLKIAERIDSRVDKIIENGGDTAEAEGFVAAARADLEAAKTSAEAFVTLDLSSDNAQENFEFIKVAADAAKGHIRSAHENLMMAVRSLKNTQNSVEDSNTDTSTNENTES